MLQCADAYVLISTMIWKVLWLGVIFSLKMTVMFLAVAVPMKYQKNALSVLNVTAALYLILHLICAHHVNAPFAPIVLLW